MKRFACLSFVLVAACGDDGTVATDASVDAAVDAPIDAPVDAPPTVYSGTLTALEVAVLNPGAGGTFFGQGIQVGISFGDSVTGVAPTMEEQPGSPLGCKLYNFTAAQAARASVGADEGNVTVTIGNQMSTCMFTDPIGYTCPRNNSASTGGIIAAGPMAGLATLTDLDVTYNAGNSTGHYVTIRGATNAANNGAFPIVAIGGANTIVYANPAFVAETIPAAGQHVNLFGVGPIPSAPDPGFMADADAAMFTLAPGGGNHFTAFTAMTANVGDDFTMPAAELAKLNALPTSGAAADFTIGCDPQVPGSTCGTATGALVNIVTTDAPTGASPFAFPLPTTKRVQIRCAAIGPTKVTVPAAYMAALQNSGFTRIQTTFMRPALMSGGPATVNALGGHAIVGFTNRAN